MPTVFEEKEQSVTHTPILLFECRLTAGQVERWSTHQVLLGSDAYEPRVLRHNLFELQTASDQGVDQIPKVSVSLANADSHFSELERTTGWKGAGLTVRFAFYDLKNSVPDTETVTLFKGIVHAPEEINESVCRLSAVNRMSMQRVLLPPIRIQRRCPWEFPRTPGEREEGVHGGERGRYSRFFRCGYSPDVNDGAGNLNGATPFTSCNFTRADCEARGMFLQDAEQNPTRRFGGIEFVPASILVRSYGESGSHPAAVTENEARYNDFVPIIYGTAWHRPATVFARNDGNLTRMEVLIGQGEIQGVAAVLVNDIEIPQGRAGAHMTGTGWYNLVSPGNRTGTFNGDFSDGSGNPLGDPYGSMAFLSVVVPNRVNDGRTLPTVKVLVQGIKLPRYDASGAYVDDQFTNNPVWVLLDVLQRCGWLPGELDMASFADAAAYCDETIPATDLYGNSVAIPRFQCNLVLKSRRTAADVIRGIRNGSRLQLTYGLGGLLRVRVENTLALQHPAKPAWSNGTSSLDEGWPSYEFGDGADGTSGLLRRDNGEPSVRLFSRTTTDTPNRFATEFQDAFNDYQQDSLSLVDVDDVARTGQEITGTISVLGISNFSQAARILKFNLDRSIQGNTYVEFESSVRALGVQPGDIITLTYLKEGFNRQPFRVLRIGPGPNFRTALVTAQLHMDEWYSDTNGTGAPGGRRQPGAGAGYPRPLIGTAVDGDGDVQFGITETASGQTDGGATVNAVVEFTAPERSISSTAGIPLVSLAASVGSGGSLAGDEVFYYAVTAVDGAAGESALSFVVRAQTPPGSGYTVTLSGLSFSSGTIGFNVYRGSNPQEMFRIAADQPTASQFVDTGLPRQVAGPPDPSFDHANFFWRLELQPEAVASIHSATTAGNSSLQMQGNQYRGMLARIQRGRGQGQEREILSNTATTVTVTSPWEVEPDSTSRFVIAETGWHFGATAASSPVQFEVPNRTGATVHVTGRAANVHNKETPPELCTVTRWQIGGAGSAGYDLDVPPTPSFGLVLPPGAEGVIEIGGISFPTLDNTRSITAATITLHYWDELGGPAANSLAVAIGASETALSVEPALASPPGEYLQIEREVIKIVAVTEAGATYEVERGAQGTTAAAHDVEMPIYFLSDRTVVAPFPRGFFGSPAGGTWTFPMLLADARVASAEMFVTNAIGISGTEAVSVTQTVDSGLRTLSGGQFSITVDGFLAIEDGIAPDLIVEGKHSIRDIYATVRQAPSGAAVDIRLKKDGITMCTLSIPSGQTISNVVDGFPLGPVEPGTKLNADITSVGSTTPGADLTILIRL